MELKVEKDRVTSEAENEVQEKAPEQQVEEEETQ